MKSEERPPFARSCSLFPLSEAFNRHKANHTYHLSLITYHLEKWTKKLGSWFFKSSLASSPLLPPRWEWPAACRRSPPDGVGRLKVQSSNALRAFKISTTPAPPYEGGESRAAWEHKRESTPLLAIVLKYVMVIQLFIREASVVVRQRKLYNRMTANFTVSRHNT